MKVNSIITYLMLLMTHLLLLPFCQGASFFKMALERDSIYTPGQTNLSLELGPKATLEGAYIFQVSVFVTDKLTRKEILQATKTEPAVLELAFPRINDKTVVRCRAELYVDGEFVEAEEKPLTLWPLPEKPSKELINKVIWVFDISGQIQKIFDGLEVKVIDATFQPARNFGKPDIVFIGENLDTNSMRTITDRLALVDDKLVTIFLKQNQLLKNSIVEIPKENNHSENMACDFDSPLLDKLGRFDLMNMAEGANYVKVKKQKNEKWSIESRVTEMVQDQENIYSYLMVIKQRKKATIYCQLPVNDAENPRCGTLLNNLLRFAYETSLSQND